MHLNCRIVLHQFYSVVADCLSAAYGVLPVSGCHSVQSACVLPHLQGVLPHQSTVTA